MKNQKIILNTESVKKVAKLANLTLSETEAKLMQEQLARVIDYIDQLSTINTENVKPTSQVTGLKNVYRDDETEKALTQEEALSGTANKNNGYFKVKAIFNNE